jgi:integrase/recombinase XerD
MQKVTSKVPSCSAILWKWPANKEEVYPVRICLNWNKDRRYYQVIHQGEKLAVALKDWPSINTKKNSTIPKKRAIQDTVAEYESKVKAAIDRTTRNGRPFTWEKFESEFLLNESGRGFLTLFFDHLETLRKEKRIGTYNAYKNAYNAFKEFRKGKEISPFDISTKVLKEFEEFLQGENTDKKEKNRRQCGKTTIAIYMRTLKVIYNLAADNDKSLLENYPFARKQTDRNRYKIKSGSGHKGEALSVEQLQKFIAIPTEAGFPDHEAKQIWLFSFHCQGMNMKDICLLKYKDIDFRNNRLRYVRAKTKDTEKQEEVIEIPLSDSIKNIINDIGNRDTRPGNYVFPIVPNGLASNVTRRVEREKTMEERITDIIKQKTKMVNTRIQKLCKDNSLDIPLTTYWARHSYANLLKQSGESIEMIRELLGHGDVKTTENYLKRFDADQKKKVNDRITSLLYAS